VATLHLFARELLVILMMPMAIAMPAEARTEESIILVLAHFPTDTKLSIFS
jgi:hypothetical protein